MSIGIGVICKNGIALASDSMTTGESQLKRFDLDKISLIESGPLKAGIVQAGMTDFSSHCVSLIRATTEIEKPKSSAEFVRIVNQSASEVRRHASSLGMQYDIQRKFELIVATCDPEPRLYRLESLSCLCRPEESAAYIGSGDILADYVLGGIQFREISIFGGLAAVVFAVEAIKGKDRDCSGPTRLAVINTQKARMLGQTAVDEFAADCAEFEPIFRTRWTVELEAFTKTQFDKRFEEQIKKLEWWKSPENET